VPNSPRQQVRYFDQRANNNFYISAKKNHCEPYTLFSKRAYNEPYVSAKEPITSPIFQRKSLQYFIHKEYPRHKEPCIQRKRPVFQQKCLTCRLAFAAEDLRHIEKCRRSAASVGHHLFLFLLLAFKGC